MTITTMHPDMRFLLDARDKAGAPGTDVAGYRRFWNAYAAATASPRPRDTAVHDRSIGPVPVRVYRPAGPDGPRAGVLYMHGGGFMLGDLDSSDTTAWGLAQGTGAVVVSVDYRLAPEHRYPAAFEDCWTVLAWLADRGREVGVDPLLLEHDKPAALVIGDEAYDAKRLRSGLAVRGSHAVIPSRVTANAPPPLDRTLYAKRNLIVRAFNRLKDYRRIATRFDKLARNFAAAIASTAIRFWYLIRV